MQRRLIVGVMGGGSASAADADMAYRLGSLIAKQGWILLKGWIEDLLILKVRPNLQDRQNRRTTGAFGMGFGTRSV